MKFKKFLTIALSAVMVTAALTGCSSSSDESLQQMIKVQFII